MGDEQPIGGREGPEEQQAMAPREDGSEEHSSSGTQGPGATHEEPSALNSAKAWAGDLFGQASEVIVRPGEFFDGLPREGGLWRATVFAIVMGAVAGILGFCLRVLPGFSSVFTMPLAAFAGTVVGAVLVHVLAMLAGGKGHLEASYRLASYLMAFLPLVVVAGVLPYLNMAMAGYALYALILGAISVHGLEERRAWSVFGVVGAALLVLALLARFADRDGSHAAHELERLRAQQQRAAERLERQIEQLRQHQAK